MRNPFRHLNIVQLGEKAMLLKAVNKGVQSNRVKVLIKMVNDVIVEKYAAKEVGK